jgi:hypothetical protein
LREKEGVESMDGGRRQQLAATLAAIACLAGGTFAGVGCGDDEEAATDDVVATEDERAADGDDDRREGDRGEGDRGGDREGGHPREGERSGDRQQERDPGPAANSDPAEGPDLDPGPIEVYEGEGEVDPDASEPTGPSGRRGEGRVERDPSGPTRPPRPGGGEHDRPSDDGGGSASSPAVPGG